ncbi:hypothetical protein QBZ16_004049 [Prototheca wickerhamii]|uniref:FAD dependent oxidoreductase domain-containing protein n=1 Tax=Prototheca wickerhamii TaxID=3111 RepID=A0AAD9MN73_PROWI|nr:hypothetical protein QBZ16_004049 [Prototheca wickerhamii]
MGSSAMYHLASQGAKVLGLESQPEAPHTQGSHHGLTRITRLAYAEHPSYVPILRRSFVLWKQLEQETGRKLLTPTGCINFSPESSPEGVSCFKGALASALEHGLEHSVMTAKECHAKYPGYCLPEGYEATFEPMGGVLCPEECIAAHLEAAQRKGARLVTGAKVKSWSADPAGGPVSVTTEDGATYTGKRLIIAAGAWMPVLVPELKTLLKVERQVVGWFSLTGNPANFEPTTFPVAVFDDESGYETDPDAVDREVTLEDEGTLRVAVERYFPEAAGPMTRAAVCLFTNTPDENFLIDRHPRHEQVIICSACSGHGFKFGSVIGEILKDLTLQGSTPLDIEFLRFSEERKGHADVLQAFASNL